MPETEALALNVPGAASRKEAASHPTARPKRRFIAGWILAWALVGCAVAAGIVFATDVDFWPVFQMSILFAEVVGVTAFTSARIVFPLFARLPYALRLGLEVLTLLSGTIFGSIAVMALQPLFSMAAFRQVTLIVLVNAVIAVIVGISLNTYDTMKRQIEASYRTLREKEALERELEIAREVQRELLPRSVPEIEGLHLAGVCLPAIEVGGDYYDYLSLDESRLAIVIADVSGKGIPAALLMASLQASVRSLFRPVPDPGELNARLNDSLFRASSASRYATLFLGFYDHADRTLRYSNAGHHPPLLLRGKDVRRLDEGGLPVGMFEGGIYAQGNCRLEKGDLLAMFTDGVVETPNDDGEEFGERRLIDLLQSNHDRDLDAVVKTVLGELDTWSGGAAAFDDVTLVLARAR